MSVIFPSYSNVDLNSVRYAMGMVDNANGPYRYESADVWRIRNVYGGPGYAFSDYVGVNFFSYIYMTQGEGYVYDGCQGRDHWCWWDGTDQNGSYIGPWSGPSTYNSEFGYGSGTFLTFGGGYTYSYTRPNSGLNIVSYSRNDYNCRAFYVDILELYSYNRIAGNFFAYAGGDQYTEVYVYNGFQSYRYFYCRLILWY